MRSKTWHLGRGDHGHLLAAGYSATELRPILGLGLDSSSSRTPGCYGKIPLLGQEYEIVRYLGISDVVAYLPQPGAHLGEAEGGQGHISRPDPAREHRGPLPLQGPRDRRCSTSRGRMLVLPDDIRAYGMEPEDLEVTAVRMSMSIPFFFEPVTEKNRKGDTCYISERRALEQLPDRTFRRLPRIRSGQHWVASGASRSQCGPWTTP